MTTRRRGSARPTGTGSAPGGVVVAPPVPRARRTILHAVRQFGDATAEEVAAALDITVSGARQQLTALAEQGLVATTAEDRREGQRGRARHRYHVTELGDAVFPKAYGALTTELLGYLADEDEDVVERLFARRREHRIEAARARLDPLERFEDKVVELAAVLDEDGYLATAEAAGPGRFRVVEHNCAIVEVARRYRQACASEIAFIRAVLPGAQVDRVSHIVEGARHCAYEIVAPPAR